MLVAPELLEEEIRSRPTVLLIHGTQDDVVPFRSMGMAERTLSAAGVAVTTRASEGVGHGVAHDGLVASVDFARRALR